MLASAEMPTALSFVEDDFTVPLAQLSANIRDMRYRRATRSAAMDRVLAAESAHLPGVERGQRLRMSVLHLFWETLGS